MKRFTLFFYSITLVAIILSIKYAIHISGWEFVIINSLYTSIIGGGIFIVGIILAGTMSDYKESERLPAEIVTALDNIHDDGIYVKHLKEKFNEKALTKKIISFLTIFQTELQTSKLSKSIGELETLFESFLEMEKLDIPANYLVRLKSELGIVKRNLHRIEHIQQINFLPSAYILFETIGLAIISMLLFTKIEPFSNGLIFSGIVSYIFLYINQLLRVIDRPFSKQASSFDNVSLFLVRELKTRLESSLK